MISDTPPCAELHVHIEGTLEPEMVFDLADRNRIRLDSSGPEELAGRYAFTNLQSFLDLYYANMDVLRTEDDFADMTTAYLRRSAAGGVRHAEVMFDPQAHTSRGIPLEVSVAGISHALRTTAAELGMSTRLIAAFLRDRPEHEAIGVLEQLLDQGAPITAIGLDSAEVGHPPAKFERLFDAARANGLTLVAHAGEEGPAEYVWEAVDLLRVFRVDHGIRSMEDERLVERLRDEQTPLTVCPLSNVRLQAVPTIEAHPLARMLDAGLRVSVHSDDPAYFGGYLDDNLRAVRDGLGLTRADLARLARNSFTSSVLPLERKGELVAEVDAWEAATA